jgi:hypothetical protein
MSPKSWAGMENVRGKRRISFCFAVILLVPEVGLEPTLPEGNRILSPLRSETRADTEGQEETPSCAQNCGQNLYSEPQLP